MASDGIRKNEYERIVSKIVLILSKLSIKEYKLKNKQYLTRKKLQL